MSILRVENLTIGYSGPIQSELAFSVLEGDIFRIVGGNGVGKSTLIKTLIGEIKPLSGKIMRNSSLTYLPQVLKNSPGITISGNELLEAYEVSPDIRELIDSYILERDISSLSGGQRQKLFILSRVTKKPSILILDEPFNHLDQNNIEDIKNLLTRLISKKLVKAIVVVSHIDIDIEHKTLELI